MNKAPDLLRNAVGSTCHRLQSDYFSDPTLARHHSARATLAELRHGATLDLAKNPLALEKALFAMQGDFSEQLASKGDAASPSERAACFALALFGVHMQGAKESVHTPGVSFAAACGQLNLRRDSNSIKPRVDAMLLANNEQSRLIHIRSLVTLLRAESIGFDYGLFARDIRSLADPIKRAGVQLKWGKDFANAHFRQAPSPTETTDS